MGRAGGLGKYTALCVWDAVHLTRGNLRIINQGIISQTGSYIHLWCYRKFNLYIHLCTDMQEIIAPDPLLITSCSFWIPVYSQNVKDNSFYYITVTFLYDI